MIEHDVWNIVPDQFPTSASFPKQIAFLVRYALLAPSAFNAQPWQFRLRDGCLFLYEDFTNRLPVVDEYYRNVYRTVSLGCAVANLIEAARWFGFNPAVEYLDTGTLIANISFEHIEPDKTALAPFIPLRWTDRTPFSEKRIKPDDLAIVQKSALPEIEVTVLQGNQKERAARLVAQGDYQRFSKPAARQEFARWLREHHSWKLRLQGVIMPWFNFGHSIGRANAQLINQAPVFIILSTKKDARRGQLMAGESFERMALIATKLGMHVHPICEGLLEIHRQTACELLAVPGFAHMAFRLGYSDTPAHHSTRQPLTEVFAD